MSKKGGKRGREDHKPGNDSERPAKCKRQVTDDKLQLYRLYEDLAAESDEVRLEAAKQLVLRFSSDSSSTTEDVQRALNRLIQGLCTQRKAARFGFCVTLTELLRQLRTKNNGSTKGLELDVGTFLKRIERQTKVEGNVSGGERRDHLIGKLFAYKAILQSSMLLEPELSLEGWNELMDLIYGMARDVPWLREECGLILIDAVDSLGIKPEFQQCIESLTQRLVSSHLVNTPEGIAVWLALREQYESKLPADVWHSKDPLSRKERARLTKVLKGDFRNASEKGKQDDIKSAAANPNPSFAWNVVLSKMLQVDTISKQNRTDADKSEFSQFWHDTIDAHLFGLTSSNERKSWGLKLFAKMIVQAPDWAIPTLFSPNLMRTLLNHTKKEDRFLHAAALTAWKAIPLRVDQSPSSALNLVVGLTAKNGTADFGNFTKAKTLEQVALAADDDSLRKIVRHLHTLILRPETVEPAVADHRRQTVADLLLNIVRQYRHYDSLESDYSEKDNWLSSTLDLLVEHAYFIPSNNAKTRKVPLPVLSDSSRKMLQERLSSCLTRLLTVKSGPQAPFGLIVIRMVRSKATISKTLEPVFKADEEVTGTIEKAFRTLEKISGKDFEIGTTSATQGFVLLYAFTLLQVYNEDADAVVMLDDLDSSRKSVLRSTKDSAREGRDGFVEILLSFLGNPRTLFHKIAIEAFTTFTSEISTEGLRSMTDILDTQESLEGQRQLFAHDVDLPESEQSDEDTEDASDVEMVDGDSVIIDASDEDGSDAESSNSAQSDSDDAEDESEEDEELTQFNNMLAMTLQTTKPSANGDASEETSEESDMDDEQMMALDPHLSKIFKQRSQITGKKEREDAKKNMVQFKSRVLDLLAIFLDKQYSSPLAMDVLLPMLRLTRASANKQLVDKSARLLKSTLESHTKHKTAVLKPDDVEAVWAILKGIHQEAKLGGSSTVHANSCSIASLHAAKVLLSLDEDHYPKIVDSYAESQKDWFADKKSPVQPVFFTQFLNWSVQFKSSHSSGQGK